MLRVILASLTAACVALGANATALAETVRDTEHNFRITVPGGWKSERNPNDEIRVVMTSSKAEVTGGTCNVVTSAHPKSATLTPAQIEAEIDKELDEGAWLAMFKSVIFIDSVAVEKTGSERLNGRKAYYVLATFNSISPGSPLLPIKLKQYLVAIPGEVFFITCMSLRDGFATEEETFQTVFKSFAPLNDTVAALELKGVPSLTLYARADFAGVSRVVTQDTADLTLYGWRSGTGSVSVAGGAPWEMCSGTNYSGSCQIVSGALASNVGRGGGVLSARRVHAASAPETLTRSLQSDVQRALVETIQRTRPVVGR